MEWFRGFRGAISLTFDDGLRSQLEIAVPLLDKYGFNATFYICPRGDDWKSKFRPWSEVASTGHEIGNHTLTHPCSCNLVKDSTSHCLDDMSLEEIEKDILMAQARIEEIAPRKKYTFAYPCYETEVGKGSRKMSYVPIVAKYFIAARAGCERSTCTNSPRNCDLYKLASYKGERASRDLLIGWAMRAILEEGWVIFTFHGINEGHLPISKYDLNSFLEFLSSYSDKLWISTVCEIAEYITRLRKDMGLI